MKLIRSALVLLLVVGTVLLVLCSESNAAVILDFEDGTPHDVPVPANHYSGLVVKNAVWIATSFPFGVFGSGAVAIGVDAGTFPVNNWAFPGVTNPIVIDFLSPVSSVSITAYDNGVNGAVLEAYNASNVLIDFDQASGTGTGNGNNSSLFVSGGSIVSIHLRQILNPTVATTDGLGWDNLTYEPAAVPEPASAVGWLLASFGLAAFARRRRASKVHS